MTGKFERLWADANLVARDRGWSAAARLLGRRLGTVIFLQRRCVVLRRTLPESPPAISPPPGYEIRVATAEDLPALAELVEPDRARLFARRMAAGRLCFVALAGAAIASYLWLAFDPSWELDQFGLHLPPNTAYSYDGLTEPAHRRQGLVSALFELSDRQARAKNIRYTLIVAARRNKISLATCRSLGYQQVGRFVYLKILGLEWIRDIRLDPEWR